MPKPEWCVYYDDGSRFSDHDGDPWSAPRVGIVAIVHADDRVGWTIVCGEDYFYYEPAVGGWRNTSQFGMYDHLVRAQRPLVLFGRMITDEHYAQVRRDIATEWGDKSGWLPMEVRRDKATELG